MVRGSDRLERGDARSIVIFTWIWLFFVVETQHAASLLYDWHIKD
jgi:hypothetical protein